jgi:hypothetical protein
MMENPELVFGIPLALAGAVGLLVAMLLLAGWGEERPDGSRAGAGWRAFLALAWLTAVEYIVAVATSYNVIALVFLAVLKVALIAAVFMSVARLTSVEEHH